MRLLKHVLAKESNPCLRMYTFVMTIVNSAVTHKIPAPLYQPSNYLYSYREEACFFNRNMYFSNKTYKPQSSKGLKKSCVTLFRYCKIQVLGNEEVRYKDLI